MLRKLLLSTAIVAVSSTFSIAADAVPIDDPVPPTVSEIGYDWTGLYVGVHGGYNHFTDDFQDPVILFNGSLSGSGGLAGIHAGYNYQIDQWLFGVEADASWLGGSGQSVADNATDVFGKAEANWEASLRARLGIVNNNWLIYATGGVGWANYDFDYAFPTPTFAIGDQFSETVHGYTVGGGVEYAFNNDWTMRLEYRYSDYGTASSGITNCCAPAPFRQEHELITQTFLRS